MKRLFNIIVAITLAMLAFIYIPTRSGYKSSALLSTPVVYEEDYSGDIGTGILKSTITTVLDTFPELTKNKDKFDIGEKLGTSIVYIRAFSESPEESYRLINLLIQEGQKQPYQKFKEPNLDANITEYSKQLDKEILRFEYLSVNKYNEERRRLIYEIQKTTRLSEELTTLVKTLAGKEPKNQLITFIGYFDTEDLKNSSWLQECVKQTSKVVDEIASREVASKAAISEIDKKRAEAGLEVWDGIIKEFASTQLSRISEYQKQVDRHLMFLNSELKQLENSPAPTETQSRIQALQSEILKLQMKKLNITPAFHVVEPPSLAKEKSDSRYINTIFAVLIFIISLTTGSLFINTDSKIIPQYHKLAIVSFIIAIPGSSAFYFKTNELIKYSASIPLIYVQNDKGEETKTLNSYGSFGQFKNSLTMATRMSAMAQINQIIPKDFEQDRIEEENPVLSVYLPKTIKPLKYLENMFESYKPFLQQQYAYISTKLKENELITQELQQQASKMGGFLGQDETYRTLARQQADALYPMYTTGLFYKLIQTAKAYERIKREELRSKDSLEYQDSLIDYQGLKSQFEAIQQDERIVAQARAEEVKKLYENASSISSEHKALVGKLNSSLSERQILSEKLSNIEFALAAKYETPWVPNGVRKEAYGMSFFNLFATIFGVFVCIRVNFQSIFNR